MRFPRLATRLVPAAAFAAFALGMASLASAGAAETTNLRECFTEDSGNTICYTIHAVEKFADTGDDYPAVPNRETGTMLIEYYDPEGNLLWSDKTQWHSFVIEKNGETQVYHDQGKVRLEDGEEICTNGMNVTYANGEVRHLGPEWEWLCK